MIETVIEITYIPSNIETNEPGKTVVTLPLVEKDQSLFGKGTKKVLKWLSWSIWEQAGYVEPNIEEFFGNSDANEPDKTVVTLPLVEKDHLLFEKAERNRCGSIPTHNEIQLRQLPSVLYSGRYEANQGKGRYSYHSLRFMIQLTAI